MSERISGFVNGLRRRASRSVRRLQGKRFIHFLHVGKTGGTAIKAALANHPVTPGHVLYLHVHKFTLRDVPVGDGVIFVLRDPITRFVSGFNSRLRQGRPRYSSPWSAGEAEAFEHFQTPNQLALTLSSKDEIERDRAHRAMSAIGHVNDHYSRWFESPDYFESRLSDIVFIGFQEQLNEDFERLKKVLTLPESLSLTTDPVRAHKTPDGLDRSLDPEAVENLRRWYQDDIDFVARCKAIMGTRSDT